MLRLTECYWQINHLNNDPFTMKVKVLHKIGILLSHIKHCKDIQQDCRDCGDCKKERSAAVAYYTVGVSTGLCSPTLVT